MTTERPITRKEREEYKRANLLRLPTWEMRMVDAGQCDAAIRRWLINEPEINYANWDASA